MEDHQSEPVKVFVRIRPEIIDGVVTSPSSKGNKTPAKDVTGHHPAQLVTSPGTHLNTTCATAVDQHSVKIMPPDGIYGSRKNVAAVDDKIFSFDHVFPETSTQEDIYQTVSEHVYATVRGYNTTIFAYGCTGSGKSYTMTGNKHSPGVIPRAIGDIFRHIENAASQEFDVFFYVRLSYVELYNNNFRNLLENATKEMLNKSGGSLSNSNPNMSGFFSDLDDFDPSTSIDSQYGTSFSQARSHSTFPVKQHPGFASRNDKIEVRESQSAGVFLAGPNLRIPVTSAQEAFQLIAKGNKLRATGITACNDLSSRSHAILTFHVESRIVMPAAEGSSSPPKSELRLGKIHLVDLAGSERLALSGAEGDTLVETQNINLSLTALGDVLSALSKNATIEAQMQKSRGTQHVGVTAAGKTIPAMMPVPYRNSKLTHLLKDSLGGNSKTIMMCTIRTGPEYYQQTTISLMYASRAKKVRNKSLVNRNVIGDTGIQNITSEIDRLKKSLEDRSHEFEKLKNIQMHDAKENNSLKARLQDLKNANENERKQLEGQVSQVIHSQAGHIAAQKQKISLLQSALQEELTVSQNRIMEQEREIRWLKKALDESSAAAQHPHEQLTRMQKVVDAWQAQVKTAHQELSTVLKQAEELKGINTILTRRLEEVDSVRKQLQDELRERSQEVKDLTNKLGDMHNANEALEAKREKAVQQTEEAQRLLQDTINEFEEKDRRLSEWAIQGARMDAENRALEGRLSSDREAAEKLAAKVAKRNADYDRTISDLKTKLNNGMLHLEKQTTQAIESSNAELATAHGRQAQAEKKAQALAEELERLTAVMDQVRAEAQQELEKKDALIKDLQIEKRDIVSQQSQQSAQILAMEGLADGFRDKISQLKNNVKSLEDELHQSKMERARLQADMDKQLAEIAESHAAEHDKVLNNFERLSQANKKEYEDNLDAALKACAIDMREKTEAKHKEAILALEIAAANKEEAHQKRLLEMEKEYQRLMEEEISNHSQKLQQEHQKHMDALSENHGDQLENREIELQRRIDELTREAEHAKEAAAQLALKNAKLAEEHVEAIASLQRELATAHTQEKTSLQVKHMKEKEALKNDHAMKLREHAELVDNHVEERKAIKAELEKHIREKERLMDDHHEEKEALRAEAEKHANELKKLRELHDTEKGSLQNELERKLREKDRLLEQYSREREEYKTEAERIAKEKVDFLDSHHDERQALHDELDRLLKERNDLIAEHQAHVQELMAQSQTEQFKERVKLGVQHQAEIEALKNELQNAKRSHKQAMSKFETKSQYNIREALDKEKAAQQALEDKHREAVAAALHQQRLKHMEELASQKAELDEQFNNDMNELHEKHIDARNQTEEDIRMHHEKLMDNMREKFATEKDEIRAEAEEALAALKSKHAAELSAAMHKGEKHLLEQHALELENLRADKRESEVRHHAALTSALEEHVDELAKLRAQLENAHAKVVNSLKHDLQEAHDHAAELTTKSATQHSNDMTLLHEQKSKYEEQIKSLLADKERLKDLEIDELNATHERAVAAMKDKHTQQLAQARMTSSESHSQWQELTEKLREDMSALREEHRNADMAAKKHLQEAEAKAKELNQNIIRLKAKHEEEVAELHERAAAKNAEQEALRREQIAAAEEAQKQMENKLKAKHKEQMQAMRDEYAAEHSASNDDMKSVLQKRDAFYQEELKQMGEKLHAAETAQRRDGATSAALIAEAQGAASALQERIEKLTRQTDAERTKLKEDHAAALAALSEKLYEEREQESEQRNRQHSEEVAALQSALKQQSDSLNQQLENLREEMDEALENAAQEFSQKVQAMEKMAAADRAVELERRQRLEDQLEKERADSLKQLEEARASHEHAVKSTAAYGDATLNRTLADLKESHQEEIAKLKAESLSEKEQLEEQRRYEATAAKRRMKELEDTLMEKLEALEFELNNEKDARQRGVDNHQAAIKGLEAQLAMEKKTWQHVHEKNLNDQLAKKEAEFDRAREALENDAQEKAKEFENERQFLRERLQLAAQNSQQAMGASEMNFRQQLNMLENELANEREQNAERKMQQQSAMAEKDKEHREMILRLEKEHARKTDELVRQLNSVAREDLRRQLDKQYDELVEKYKDDATNAQRESEAYCTKLRDQLSAAEKAAKDASQKVFVLESRLAENGSTVNNLTDDIDALKQFHVAEMAAVQSKAKLELDAQKAELSAHYDQLLELNADNTRKEIALHTEDIRKLHKKEVEMLRAQHQAQLDEIADAKEREVLDLSATANKTDDENKDLRRQLHKLQAHHDAVKQELDGLRAEEAGLRDTNNALQVEVINHGKAKFDKALQAEKEKLEQQYVDVIQDSRGAATRAEEANKNLTFRLAQAEVEVASLRTVAKVAEDEKDRVENMFKNLLEERDASHASELKKALKTQHDELQGGYLQLIQQQVDALMKLVLSQNNQGSISHVEEMQNRMFALIQDLPGLWQEKNGGPPVSRSTKTGPSAATPMATPNMSGVSQTGSTQHYNEPRTPIHLLAGASDRYRNNQDDASFDPRKSVGNSRLMNNTNGAKGSSGNLPWSSPSLKSSPTDQLIAAILDGDVQGVRAVVRSKGDDLQSDFWRDLSKTVLPLHRAVSGLHFHGSDKLLVATIEALVQLGAEVNAVDHAGNSVLHKTIQVCTSKSVAAVVQTLLHRGAHPSMKNKDGDTPLLAECKRVRTASVSVIQALINAGADPNCKNINSANITPLTLVVMRGAASTAVGANLIGPDDEALCGVGFGVINGGSPSQQPVVGKSESYDGSDFNELDVAFGAGKSAAFSSSGGGGAASGGAGSSDIERSRSAGRRVWIKAAEALVHAGARWDSAWRTTKGCTLLHLFLAAFPPAREDSSVYRSLLKDSLDAHRGALNSSAEDDRGRNALFMLCEQMSCTTAESCPDASRILHMVLDSSPVAGQGVGGSDRTGRTVFDIQEKVANSCLVACRHILLDANKAAASSSSNHNNNNNNNNRSYSNGQSSNRYGGAASISTPQGSATWAAPASSVAIYGNGSRDYGSSDPNHTTPQQYGNGPNTSHSSRGGGGAGGNMSSSYNNPPKRGAGMYSSYNA